MPRVFCPIKKDMVVIRSSISGQQTNISNKRHTFIEQTHDYGIKAAVYFSYHIKYSCTDTLLQTNKTILTLDTSFPTNDLC